MRKTTIVLIFILITAACTAISLSKPVKAANWQQVTVISGSDSQTSSEFMVNGSEWRIRWSFSRDAQYPSLTAFSFFIYPHGETSIYEEYISQSSGEENTGTLNLQGTGLHYVQVLAANTQSYTLIVEYNTETVASDTEIVFIVVAAIAVPTVLLVIIMIFVRKKFKKQKLVAAPVLPPPPPPPKT
jgi:hypothetical protein